MVILASASPRRQALLMQIGCKFEVISSEFEEDNSQDLLPKELAIAQAKAKAMDVAKKISSDHIVIGADTIVVLNGQVYGKPLNMSDAYHMLKNLSGKTHQVITGVAVIDGKSGKIGTDCAVTNVTFLELTNHDIEKYIMTGESLGKAGAYAIQGLGVLLVAGIDGCYTNVVGLPLVTLTNVFKKMGIDPF